MTIGRMDNVVAREVLGGIVRHEDGSYEATVELVRLGDGAVVGRASALCGTADDKPWNGRSEPNRRSMAVTRATSRAFRQHYAWIMVLAGYEPTPADEMPRDEKPQDSGGRGGGLVGGAPVAHPVADGDTTVPWLDIADVTITGAVTVGTPPFDLELRPTEDGLHRFGFRLDPDDGNKRIPQVLIEGALAADVADAAAGSALIWAQPVTVRGDLYRVPWEKPKGHAMPPFQRLVVRQVRTAEWTLPDDAIEAELDAIAAGLPEDVGAK